MKPLEATIKSQPETSPLKNFFIETEILFSHQSVSQTWIPESLSVLLSPSQLAGLKCHQLGQRLWEDSQLKKPASMIFDSSKLMKMPGTSRYSVNFS